MQHTRVTKTYWRLAMRSLVVVAALYALLGFVLVPMIARQQVLSFTEQRLGAQSRIDTISLNPFTFNVGISGAQLTGQDAQSLLSFDRLSLNFQPTSLLFGELVFSEISIDGLHASLRRRADGGSNVADLLQRWNANATEQRVDESAAAPSSGPALRIDALRVTGASLGLVDETVAPAFQTLIESIDFSVDELSTSADSSAQQRLTLSIGEGSQLSWAGTLGLAPLQSSGELQLVGPLPRLAYRYFQGQIPVLLEGGWFDASLHYDFGFTDAGEPDLKIERLDAALTNLDVRDRQSEDLLLRLPALSLQGGRLDLLQQQGSVAQVMVEGVRLEAERAADGIINLQAAFAANEGEPQAQSPAVISTAPPTPWRLQLDALVLRDWDLRVRDLLPEQALSVNVAFNANANNLSNLPSQSIQLDTDVSLSSGGSLNLEGDLTVLPELAFAGQLDLVSLALPVLQPYLARLARVRLDTGTFNVAGKLEATLAQSQFNGRASVETLLIRDTLENEDLFALASLAVDDAVVSIGQVQRINIGGINVQAPYARIEIDDDGSNNISRVLRMAPEESAPRQTQGSQESEPGALPEVRIAQIRLAQGGADFSDRSLPLPFAVRIDGLGGEVSAFSTRSNEPTRIALEGQVDEYGLASIGGRVRPLDFAQLTEIDLTFRNLNIPSLSPYVIKFAGRTIADGALDVDLAYRINNSQLDGANAMVMRDLRLGERVEHPEAMDLPLGLAIALLKDGNGVIDLDVPVAGDIASPQFNYGNVVRTALGNIIRNIVASPFKFLASLVGGDEDSDIGIIEFVPGRSDLQPPQREKLAQLAQALMQRPQLQLDLLGRYSSSADTGVLKEQFFNERFEQALGQLDNDIEPALQRLQLLEQFAMAQAPEGSDVRAELLVLRQEHTLENATGERQFDDLAYAQALRRSLIAQEEVSVEDLERLASARVSAIAAALGALEASLASRMQTLPEQEEVMLEGGNVPIALALSSL